MDFLFGRRRTEEEVKNGLVGWGMSIKDGWGGKRGGYTGGKTGGATKG